jgi:hypothetical protein
LVERMLWAGLKVFSMSSGVRDVGENLESCSQSPALRESGASCNEERTGAEGGEIRRLTTTNIDGISSSEEASGVEFGRILEDSDGDEKDDETFPMVGSGFSGVSWDPERPPTKMERPSAKTIR